MDLTIAPATADDVEPCGRIIYEAFTWIAEQHGFPPDFLSVEAGVRTARFCTEHPAVAGFVARLDGGVAGSAFVDERDPIRGVGPVSVDPAVHDRGAGRALMQAVLERCSGAVGVRLVQDAFNTVSLPLYASLGFAVTEPLALLAGAVRDDPPPHIAVRPLREDDLPACAALCKRVHGFPRTEELRDALRGSTALVAVRDGRLSAYASAFSLRGHGVAESDDDLAALLAAAPSVSILLPLRQGGLFRWCLEQGLRVVKPMNLMALGAYQEPRGCWFPSVSY